MGKTKVSSTNILTPEQNRTLDSILSQTSKDTTYLSDYLKNIISGGTDSSRVQQAISNYKENIVPQLIGSLGDGKSSSALNQALSTGSQTLAQNIDADSMTALQMLQQLTQGNVSAGLGTQANMNLLQPGRGQVALNALLGLLSGVGGQSLGGLLGGSVGRFAPFASSSISSWVKGLFR